MFRIAITTLILAQVAMSSMCKENIFLHTIYGWNGSLVLDSLKGDRNAGLKALTEYSYGVDKRIALHNYTDANRNQQTMFIPLEMDSLVWMQNSVMNNNWIKYTKKGYISVWERPSIIYRDTLRIEKDSLVFTVSEIYSNGDSLYTKKIGYATSKGYDYRYIRFDGALDTSLVSCIETNHSCECKQDGLDTFKITRGAVGTSIADTLWVTGAQKEIRYFTGDPAASVQMRYRKPNLTLPLLRYDLLGRSILPQN